LVNSSDLDEEEVTPEENEIWNRFISKFQPSDAETSTSESESSETEEQQAFPEVEEQILPMIAPRPLNHSCSCDSALSEDALNLLHFNQGFDLYVEDDDEEEVASSIMLPRPSLGFV